MVSNNTPSITAVAAFLTQFADARLRTADCVGYPAYWWDSRREKESLKVFERRKKRAQKICANCSCVASCLEVGQALPTTSRTGIWGGVDLAAGGSRP